MVVHQPRRDVARGVHRGSACTGTPVVVQVAKVTAVVAVTATGGVVVVCVATAEDVVRD